MVSMWYFGDEEESELKSLILIERVKDRETHKAEYESIEPIIKEANAERVALRVSQKAKKIGWRNGLIAGIFYGAIGVSLIRSFF